MNINPLVSIIIPTLNSGKLLKTCLSSIRNQTYKNLEIIIVDQSSTDKTVQIAKKFGAKVRIIPKPKFYSPPPKSRNIGAKIAKGKILYHVDSDMDLSPGLVSEFVKIFKNNKNIGACTAHEIDITNNFWGKCKALERKCYFGNEKIESARIVKKQVFNNVSGYDENISTGEDFDIHRKYRNATKIGICVEPVFHHVENSTFFSLIIKKFNYGKNASRFFNKNNIPWYELIFIEFRSYVHNYKLLLQQPLITFGMLLLKICEMLAGLCGILSKKF